jgi:hypothetical protein
MSTCDRAATLHAVTRSLGVPYGHERSIKLRRHATLANRFLLTIARDDLGPTAVDRVLDACRQLEMPDEFLDAVAAQGPPANMIHFGFEEEAAGRAHYKVYLEREAAFATAMTSAPAGGEPFVLHHAFKWNVADGADRAVARYVCHPRLARQAMLQRIAAVYAGRPGRAPWHLVCELVTAAARRVPEEAIMYLDVTEDGTDRRSFDVNVYRAGLPVESLAPFFDRLADHFQLRAAAVAEAFAAVLGLQLGHVAGGIDRHGRDFFTIYFGVEGRG